MLGPDLNKLFTDCSGTVGEMFSGLKFSRHAYLRSW